MVIEGSGSGSRAGSGSGFIPLTSGSGSGRPQNMWIRWIRIRIRNTGWCRCRPSWRQWFQGERSWWSSCSGQQTCQARVQPQSAVQLLLKVRRWGALCPPVSLCRWFPVFCVLDGGPQGISVPTTCRTEAVKPTRAGRSSGLIPAKAS